MEVNPFELPSLPLSERKFFPKKLSAIYFAISKTNEILYIGRANCLHTRWSGYGHHRRIQLEELGGVRIAWMQVSDPALLPDIELKMINYFAPNLNGVSGYVIAPAKQSSKKRRDKSLKMRLNKLEWEALEREALRRDVPKAQIIREGLRQVLNLD